MPVMERRAEAEAELARQTMRSMAWETALEASLHRYRTARVRYVANNCFYLNHYDEGVPGEDAIGAVYKRRAIEAGEQMNIERSNIRTIIENIHAAELAYRIQWEEIQEMSRVRCEEIPENPRSVG